MNGSNWFATEYDYSGYAEATFEEPHVEFRGPASVRPDENGRPIVEITVEQSNPPVQTQFDIMEVQFGSQPIPGGGRLVAVGCDGENRVRATVCGEQGIFKSGPDWNYDLSGPPDAPLTLRINPVKSEFTAAGSAAPAFLILPLSGFLPEFPAQSSAIRGHPLSLDVEPNSHVRSCISFEVRGQRAFIQQLPTAVGTGEGMKACGGDTVLTALAVLPMVDREMADP